jgi:hypothetical protein
MRVDKWEDALVLGKGLAGHVFRGQLDSTWLLSTTLERASRRYGFPEGGLRNREVVLCSHRVDPPKNRRRVSDALRLFRQMLRLSQRNKNDAAYEALFAAVSVVAVLFGCGVIRR